MEAAEPQSIDSAITSARPSLTNLPVDVIILIFLQLPSPVDVLRIRKTCRHLSEITRDSSLWFGLLRILLAEEYLPTSTFPIRDMTGADAENAVLRGPRFDHLISHHGPKSRGHGYINVSNSVSNPGEELHNPGSTGARIESFHIIPGGRWLLVFTDRRTIQCWDLGIEGRPFSLPVAQFHTTQDISVTSIIECSQDRNVVYVFTQYRPEHLSEIETGFSIEVFELHLHHAVTVGAPVTLVPTGRQACIPSDLRFPASFYDGNLVMLESVRSVVIWGWKDDTWGRLSIDEGSHVVTFHSETQSLLYYHPQTTVIQFYRIPELRRRTSDLSNIPNYSTPPLLTISLNIGPGMMYAPICWGPHCRLNGLPLVVLTEPNGDEPVQPQRKIFHFRLKESGVIPLGTPGQVYFPTPGPITTVVDFQEPSPRRLSIESAIETWSGRLFSIVSKPGMFFGLTTDPDELSPTNPVLSGNPIEVEAGPPRFQALVDLVDETDAFDYCLPSICPISGRFCVWYNTRPDQLRVVSYVP